MPAQTCCGYRVHRIPEKQLPAQEKHTVKVVSLGKTHISFQEERKKDSLKRIDNFWIGLIGMSQLSLGNHLSPPEVPTGLYRRSNNQMKKTLPLLC